MKKVIRVSLLLAVIASIAMLAGCGSKDEIPEDGVTLTIGIPQNASVTDYENNEFT